LSEIFIFFATASTRFDGIFSTVCERDSNGGSLLRKILPDG